MPFPAFGPVVRDDTADLRGFANAGAVADHIAAAARDLIALGGQHLLVSGAGVENLFKLCLGDQALFDHLLRHLHVVVGRRRFHRRHGRTLDQQHRVLRGPFYPYRRGPVLGEAAGGLFYLGVFGGP